MNDNNISITSAGKTNEVSSKFKKFLIIFEISLAIILLVVWYSFESIRKSKLIWVLYFYSYPSNFFISILPHEPAILYFGKFYSPLIVALVCIAGVVPTEIINYSVIKFFADLRLFKKASQSKFVSKVVELFNKAPFTALLIAGLTPIPFYPFRFLVVLADYPLIKYLSAVFLSRTPRYFFLAFIGYALKIPDYLLIAIFIILLLTANIPFVTNLIKNRKRKKPIAS
jgi:membrane protein YqaA with SNARE-associated domain